MRKIHGRFIQMECHFSWYHTIAIPRKIKQLNQVECFICVFSSKYAILHVAFLKQFLRIAIGYLLKIFCYAKCSTGMLAASASAAAAATVRE